MEPCSTFVGLPSSLHVSKKHKQITQTLGKFRIKATTTVTWWVGAMCSAHSTMNYPMGLQHGETAADPCVQLNKVYLSTLGSFSDPSYYINAQ